VGHINKRSSVKENLYGKLAQNFSGKSGEIREKFIVPQICLLLHLYIWKLAEDCKTAIIALICPKT